MNAKSTHTSLRHRDPARQRFEDEYDERADWRNREKLLTDLVDEPANRFG